MPSGATTTIRLSTARQLYLFTPENMELVGGWVSLLKAWLVQVIQSVGPMDMSRVANHLNKEASCSTKANVEHREPRELADRQAIIPYLTYCTYYARTCLRSDLQLMYLPKLKNEIITAANRIGFAPSNFWRMLVAVGSLFLIPSNPHFILHIPFAIALPSPMVRPTA